LKVIHNHKNSSMEKSNRVFSGKELVEVPIVGKVPAGQPILALENIEDTFPLPVEYVQNSTSYMLKVNGESMVEAGILDGDMVLVRQQSSAENGDIVVALIGEEATVKTFYKEKDYIRLQPQNQYMDPIIVKDNVSILGKVTGVFRKL
jgi:repressor LexA